jgi:ubiquitin-conjugating enzyme E2 D/E
MMMCQHQISSLKQHTRLTEEMHSLQSNGESGWYVESYYPNDFKKWRLYLSGLYGTPYEKGEFQLALTFPVEYPFKVPNFRFDTKIFHPNVDATGMLCIHHANYNPTSTIRSLLQDVMSIIRNPTPDYFINGEAAFLLYNDPELFKQKAIEWTKNYSTNEEIISNLSSPFSSSGFVSKTSEKASYIPLAEINCTPYFSDHSSIL